MKVWLLCLLVACGGGRAAPRDTHTPTTPTAGEENWTAYLAQLVGPTCTWIRDATFVVCDRNKLIGWEPHNRRYVLWLVGDSGEVTVLVGQVGGTEWIFEGAGTRVTLRKDSDAQWTLVGDGRLVTDMVLSTSPIPAPAPRNAGTKLDDWRSQVEPFVGVWSFTGTAQDQPLQFRVTCRWITGATFATCKVDGAKGFALIGYEPQNGRLAQYAIGENGETEAFAGTYASATKTWTFTGTAERLIITQETGLRMTLKGERMVGKSWQPVLEGAYETQLDTE